MRVPLLAILALTLTLPGLASTELVLGQSAAFSGPSGMLGSEYRAGALAYFAEVNRQGGVHGKRLKLTDSTAGPGDQNTLFI